MGPRTSDRRSRRTLITFLFVASVTTGALAVAVWLLLEQDRELEASRRARWLNDAADATVARMQQELLDLTAVLQRRAAESIGPTISIAEVSPTASRIISAAPLPFRPTVAPRREADAELFADAERAEWQDGRLNDAVRLYARWRTHEDPRVRAGALARLARVHRKMGNLAAALRAYQTLETIPDAAVFGLPADLVARLARVEVSRGLGGQSQTQATTALAKDLLAARWPLLAREFDAIVARLHAGSDESILYDADTVARARALEWIWTRRSSLEPSGRLVLTLEDQLILTSWQIREDAVAALVASPLYLKDFCHRSVPPGLGCAITDPNGSPLDRPVPSGALAVSRDAASARLPWATHVYFKGGAEVDADSRSALLVAVLSGTVIVLAAGWYFILRSLSREARAARMQTDFVAAVSHEFRSPLTSLAHIADLLADDRFADADAKRASYGVLQRETQRLRDLVETLLDFGRFERGAEACRFEILELRAVLQDAVSAMQERVGGDGYTIELMNDTSSVQVRADREALIRAISNLLDNAVKYSADHRTICVSVAAGPEQVTVAVSDRGMGIPPHEQQRIFERFVRGELSAARRIRGTGLGLAMVRQIARAHGGDLALTSEVGVGSTFTLTLPIAA